MALVSFQFAHTQVRVTRPVVSEEACPLETLAPVSQDGHRGLGLLRKPPGAGLFPAVVLIHGGMTSLTSRELLQLTRSATPSRFLAAGYVTAVPTYRSRDDNPQSRVSLEDILAVIDYLKRQPNVDAKSVVVFGCSGGGDLALEAAAATEVCAITSEEPASLIMAGILDKKLLKNGGRFTPMDAVPILLNPSGFYTDDHRKILRTKLTRIRCPILIIEGDEGSPINKFNAAVLLPELKTLRNAVEVLSYPGEPHCFCFYGGAPPQARMPPQDSSGRSIPAAGLGTSSNPAAALKAFRDSEAFFQRHLTTRPSPVDQRLLELVQA